VEVDERVLPPDESNLLLRQFISKYESLPLTLLHRHAHPLTEFNSEIIPN